MDLEELFEENNISEEVQGAIGTAMGDAFFDRMIGKRLYDDAYWLRYFAAAALKGYIGEHNTAFESLEDHDEVKYWTKISVLLAKGLLDEIKLVESKIEGKK